MNEPDVLVKRLQAALDQHYPAWGIIGLTPVGAGLENLVCRGHSAQHGPLAIRVPWTRWISNANDPAFDARLLLQQEAALATHLARHGVPVPAVHALHLSDELDFLVCDFVPGDGTPPDPEAMGRVTAAIHQAPPLDFPLVAMEGRAVHDVVAQRLEQRTRRFAEHTGWAVPLPDTASLAALLKRPGASRSILHMDIRDANFLTREGRILAVVDWGNALLGDPALELARIAEYGILDERFLTGYGIMNPFAGVARPTELLYRLDTAVMLALVFLSEAPDPVAAQRQARRVEELSAELQRLL